MEKTIQMGPKRDINGTLMTNLQQKKNKWTEYISKLFIDKDPKEIPDQYKEDARPDIIK